MQLRAAYTPKRRTYKKLGSVEIKSTISIDPNADKGTHFATEDHNQ